MTVSMSNVQELQVIVDTLCTEERVQLLYEKINAIAGENLAKLVQIQCASTIEGQVVVATIHCPKATLDLARRQIEHRVQNVEIFLRPGAGP